MYRIILFLIGWGIAASASAQSGVYTKQYTSSDGLASSMVYHVASDSKGYLWFATDKGVSRFNGKTFATYSVLDGLGDNTNFNFFEDRDGTIWPFAYNGRHCFFRENRIVNGQGSALLRALPGRPFVNAMCRSSDGSLYIGFISGDVVRVSGTTVFPFFRHRDGDGHISLIVEDGGLIKVYGNRHWRYFRSGRLVYDEDHGANNAFYYNRTLLVADSAGVRTYRDGRPDVILNDSRLSFKETIHLYADTAGNVFCSTQTGLYVFSRRTGSLRQLLANSKVSCCVQSISGDYWATTLGQGAWCINQELDRIEALSAEEALKVSATGHNRLFLATGRNVYVPARVGRSVVLQPLWLPHSAKGSFQPLSLDSNLFLYNEAQHNRICFANLATKAVRRIQTCDKYVLALPGHLYMGSAPRHLRQYYFDGTRVSTMWEQTHTAANAARMLYDSAINQVYILRDDTLFLFDPALRRIRPLIQSPALKNVSSIFKLRGYIFFVSDAPRIIFLAPEGPAVLREIPIANVIYRSSGVDDSTALINTQKGDYLVSLTERGFRASKITYPLAANEYDDMYPVGRGFLISHNGRCYVIDRALLNRRRLRPSLILSEVRANGAAFSPAAAIRLRRTDHCELNITASTLYFHGIHNTVQYRIVDNDTNDWNTVETSTISVMFNRYGRYVVQLRAVDDNGQHSPVQTIPIELTPPFYRTNGAYAAAGMLLLGLAAWGFRSFNQKRKRSFLNELNYLKLEHKSVNSLLNPHFVFNVINNIQGLINTGSKERASDYLAMMSTLIRQNIENLQFDLIHIDRELELVRNYIDLQNMRLGNAITLQITCDPAIHDNVFIPPLLIHTFVENSVLHGMTELTPHLDIHIEITIDARSYLLLRITDNGAGLDRARPAQPLRNKTSLGISFNRNRLERISSFYRLESSVVVTDRSASGAAGTEVCIILYSRLQELIGA